ncbi:amino acid adenylation domain-containing protein [Chromobacterium amazonense]|uniref:non-ribosomal peptide synthetase n=1 Tax=Chromobacterium amazonense TaxID=1382803 RepID=UPI00237E174A|nr:amino acid adenylation domain-containing protein [Chromobacterium amazonense]MDE1715950.1 amino acid adenylation domain-containing protein [Chromobacterium amazonense]
MRTTPLSTFQYRFWLEWQLNPRSSSYTTPLVYRLTGALDRAALLRSLDDFVHRYDEGCRSIFLQEGEQVRRHVLDRVDVALEYRDAAEHPALDQQDIAHWVEERISHVFALDEPVLFRFSLLREREDRHLLVLCFPHIISDAFSAAYINQCLTALYNHHHGGQAMPLVEQPDFNEYLASEQQYLASPQYLSDLEYWRAALSQRDLGIELAPLQAGGEGWSDYRFGFGVETLNRLKKQAKQNRATLFLALSSLYACALAKWRGINDFVLTYPVNMRTAGFRGASGCYVNNLPMWFSLKPNQSLRDIVAETAAQRTQSKARQQLSLTDMVTALRRSGALGEMTIFNVSISEAFFVQAEPLGFAGIESELLPVNSLERPFDLNFAYQATPDGLFVKLEYKKACLSEAQAADFAGCFSCLLDAYLEQNEQPALAIDLLGPGRRAELDSLWHGPQRPGKDLSWPQRFQAQQKALPDGAALSFGTERLNYSQLDDLSARLAGYLVESREAKQGELIGLYCERSTEMVLAILSVLRLGAAYVPLDPDAPLERTRKIIADAGLRLVLTQQHLANKLSDGAYELTLLDQRQDWIGSPQLPARTLHPDSLAYVIYTSGSTGTPKGVANTHRALVNRLDWHSSLLDNSAGGAVRVLQKTPYFFDVSVWEFLWPLQSGYELLVAPPGMHQDPAALRDLISRERVTVAHFVPSMLSAFLDSLDNHALADLKLVVCSGEALFSEQAERCLQSLPNAKLFNLYGPTEAAIDVSYWQCQPGVQLAQAGVPIGYPIDNLALYVLDKELDPCPPGRPGELYIGGMGLAQCYVGRPDLTAASFIPDPYSGSAGSRMYCTGDLAAFGAKGELHYLGRRDDQVKINGNRIEIQDVEACLRAVQGVALAAVVPVEVQGRVRQLHAFVERTPGSDELLEKDLHAHAAALLPAYMLPARIEIVERIELLPAGKINRKALRQLAQARLATSSANGGRAATPFQAEIADEWRSVLGEMRIGPDDNFFRLGGSSIQAIQLIGRLNRRYQLLLAPPLLFAYSQLDAFCTQVLLARGEMAQQRNELDVLLDQLSSEDMDELLEIFTLQGALA